MKHFKLGQKVRVSAHNDNNNYDDFRGETLIIKKVSKSVKDHPGYDEGVSPQWLYDLEIESTGTMCGCSLYDYELEVQR
jgi:hypothetical protein